MSLGSPEVPRLICSRHSQYPLVAIGGGNILDSSTPEKIARELARTLSFMSSRVGINKAGESVQLDLLERFYLFSLVCEIRCIHLLAHFASWSASGWTYHTIYVTTVHPTTNEHHRDFALLYLLTWVQKHTIQMAERLDAHLSELSDMELAECQQEFLRPLPMFERTKVSQGTIFPPFHHAE